MEVISRRGRIVWRSYHVEVVSCGGRIVQSSSVASRGC